MSFSVSLSPDLVAIEPGATTPVSIVVTNRGPEADRFELDIEGIDPEWKAVPVPVFGADPGEVHSEKVFLKPPRTSESRAGNYPFVVRVRSLVSGEQKVVQGVAQIKPFHHLSMEISPRKGFVSPIRKQNTFGVTLVNLGNTDHNIQLVGSDPEDACTYEFDTEQAALTPGQQREVEVVVVPASTRLVFGGRLIGFTVTGRSVDTPSVAATSQAQLEQRPLLTPAAVAVFVVLAVIIGAWFLMLPKPPTIDLAANPRRVLAGESVTVNWSAENARQVVVKAGEQLVYEGPELKGTRTITMTDPGEITIRADAIYHDQRRTTTSQVTVTPTPTVPAPVIETLTIDRNRIRLGETFILHYKVGASVTSAVLQPTGLDLDPALDEREIAPSRAGKLEYTLVARNSAGQQVEKAFTINVVDESDARVLALTANTKRVTTDDPRVILTWQVIGAERVEIGPVGSDATPVAATGSQEFPMSKKTTFQIVAFDAKGRRTVQSITIDFVTIPTPIPDMPTPGEPGSPATTGSGTTGTPTGGNDAGSPTGTPPTTTGN